MARFHGVVGYGETLETFPGSGIWEDEIEEYFYFGDVVRNNRKLEEGLKVNSDIEVQNSISIVADQFAIEHFYKIRYVQWMGVNWTVSKVDVQSPRLILSLGSVYNGPTA